MSVLTRRYAIVRVIVGTCRCMMHTVYMQIHIVKNARCARVPADNKHA